MPKKKPTLMLIKSPPVPWEKVLLQLRPFVITTLDYVVQTGKVGKYAVALKFLGNLISIIPVGTNTETVKQIRKIHKQLVDLGDADPEKRQALQEKLSKALEKL